MQLRALSLCALIMACGSSEAQDGDPNAGSGGETNSGGASQTRDGGKTTGGGGGSGLAGGSGGAAGHAGSNAAGAGGTNGSGGTSSSGGSSGGAAGTASGGAGGAPNCTVPTGQGVTKVACVGDSITAGHGASDPSKSYPAQLSVLLGNAYDVGNFGRDSATMLKNGDFPYWNQSQFRDAQAFLPNVVVIGLGTNDVNNYGNYARLSEFPGDYAAMVDLFRALATHPVVFAVLPMWIKEDDAGNGLTNARLGEVITLIEGVAADKGVCTIDLNSVSKDHPELYSDSVHPNDAGYGLIAKTVCQAIGGGCQ